MVTQQQGANKPPPDPPYPDTWANHANAETDTSTVTATLYWQSANYPTPNHFQSTSINSYDDSQRSNSTNTTKALNVRATCMSEFGIFGCVRAGGGWLVAGFRSGIGGCSNRNGLRYRKI